MQKILIFIQGFFILFFFSALAFPVDDYNYQTDAEMNEAGNVTARTMKNVQGLYFHVEEDRPIVKVAGVYRPMDMDSYIALKFGKLSKMIVDLSNSTDQRIADLNRKVEDLTQRAEDLTQKVEELSKNKEKNKTPQNQTVSNPAPK